MLFLERGGGDFDQHAEGEARHTSTTPLGCTVIVSKAISGLALGHGAQPKQLGLLFGFMVIDHD